MPRYRCFRTVLGVDINVMVGAATIQETTLMHQLPDEFLALQLDNSSGILDAVDGIKLTSSEPMTA